MINNIETIGLNDALRRVVKIRLDRRENYGDDIFSAPEEDFKFLLKMKMDRIMHNIKDEDTKLDNIIDLAIYALIYYQSLINKNEVKV
jgi:hypothetical protein